MSTPIGDRNEKKARDEAWGAPIVSSPDQPVGSAYLVSEGRVVGVITGITPPVTIQEQRLARMQEIQDRVQRGGSITSPDAHFVMGWIMGLDGRVKHRGDVIHKLTETLGEAVLTMRTVGYAKKSGRDLVDQFIAKVEAEIDVANQEVESSERNSGD